VSGYRLPPPAGAWIDRKQPLRLSFNGRAIDGFAGDTVASALLACGVTHIGRSIKLHRPRGIFSCGVEEPTGLLDIGTGATRTPNTRATDVAAREGLVAVSGNAWPSLELDLAALNQKLAAVLRAGFYYKTFMWPHWHLFEPLIRRLAGSGFAADAPDPDRYDEVSRSVDTLVIGAGAAGMQAAVAAANSGREVLLLEGAARVGGWLACQVQHPESARRLQPLERALATSGVEVRTGCNAIGLYDHRLAVAVEQVDGNVRERLWKVRAHRIVLATGAFERPLLFPDNDRPGVMLASAVERYATHYGVACGRRIVVATACDSGYGVAHSLRAAGIDVAAIVELRPSPATAAPSGIPVFANSAIVAVEGNACVRAVTIARRDGASSQRIDADCIAVSGGWTPAVHLHSIAGGRLRWVDDSSMFVPESRKKSGAGCTPDGIETVGACSGAFDLDRALEHAGTIGRGEPAEAPVGGIGFVPASTALPGLRGGDAQARVFVDLQSDVTAADVELAARENYRSVEHLKRYTTLGMATDQGKTSNVNALVLMGEETGRRPAEVGTTKFRPPFKPVTLGAIAGGRGGERFRPLKRLPAHRWHEDRGALFEEFGGWLRPAAYPRNGESLVASAEREALHARTHVGVFDASPLGKIEIYGPDAAGFLDLMYAGTMSTLAIGQARYGVLLDENGVIADDGIVARLGDGHFWINTTSGGAERVALAFEEWLQCEHVRLRALVTPVTAAWGNVTVTGPKAWQLLKAAGFDPLLAPPSMRHMTIRESGYGALAMRVLRASYSGELSYEINLPAQHTHALLQRLSDAGRGFDLQPYGIEALMILRTEKGYLHVGADTDGTTLPGDVGLDRGIGSKQANFAGRRSLLRPAAREAERMRLVGLVPVDRSTRIPVGAHIAPRQPPAPIDGFVTSSAFSPVLGHPVALAMLARGAQRTGARLTAYHMGRAIAVEVVPTPFFDPEGRRLDG
jgi:sarcosine oxidase subunit alpha